MERNKLIEVFGKGGPARDIMLGTATGGVWADEICDALVAELSEECPIEPDELALLIDKAVETNMIAITCYFNTAEYTWQVSTSPDRHSWTITINPDLVTALIDATRQKVKQP